MKEVLEGIRADVGAENCRESCSRDGCRVSLEDIPGDRIVVDADKAFQAHGREGKKCDFILFVLEGGRKLVAAPVELKSGGVDVSDALEQLQAGAAFAERFAPEADGVECRPILFHGSAIHRNDRSTLNRKKIRFRGADLTVKTKRCGRPRNLAEALEIRTAVASRPSPTPRDAPTLGRIVMSRRRQRADEPVPWAACGSAANDRFGALPEWRTNVSGLAAVPGSIHGLRAGMFSPTDRRG